jgi:hypothetical protein
MAYPAAGQNDLLIAAQQNSPQGVPWPATHTENVNPLSGKTVTGATTTAGALLRLAGGHAK